MRQLERDVIVVGSGPSGAAAASYCALQGLDTLLIDKDIWPRDRACSDIYAGNTLDHIKELGAWNELIETAMIGSRSKIVSPENEETIIGSDSFPLFWVQETSWVFDDLMRRTAIKHGAEMWQNCWVYDLIKKNGYIKGIKCKYQGEEIEIRSKIVIGADGSNSIIAKQAGIIPENPESYCIGIRAYFKNVDLDPKLRALGFNEFYFDKDNTPNYFWISPSGKYGLSHGFCNIGMYINTNNNNKESSKEELVKVIENWMKNSPCVEQFKNAHQCSPWKIWKIPNQNQKIKNYGNGFMLIGKAGANGIPFVNECLSTSMDSAKFAAEAAKIAIDKNNYSEYIFYNYYSSKLLKKYNDKVKTFNFAKESFVDPSVSTKLIHKFNEDEEFKEKFFKEIFKN